MNPVYCKTHLKRPFGANYEIQQTTAMIQQWELNNDDEWLELKYSQLWSYLCLKCLCPIFVAKRNWPLQKLRAFFQRGTFLWLISSDPAPTSTSALWTFDTKLWSFGMKHEWKMGYERPQLMTRTAVTITAAGAQWWHFHARSEMSRHSWQVEKIWKQKRNSTFTCATFVWMFGDEVKSANMRPSKWCAPIELIPSIPPSLGIPYILISYAGLLIRIGHKMS
jgi:hypothetical protein